MNVGLYQAASALRANSRWQEVIAENLASSSVPGYRKQEISFAAVQAGLMPAGPQAGAGQNYTQPRVLLSRSFQPGEMRATDSPTDVGVAGGAFLEVQLPNGTTAYTRDGDFHISAQGQLVNRMGYPVLTENGPVQVDLNDPSPISISSEGEISQGSDMKGRLKLTDVDNPQRLTPAGNGLFLASDPAIVLRPSTTSSVLQGWLEGANTSPILEMATLMTAMRAFEVNQRLVQSQDERLGKTITELAGS